MYPKRQIQLSLRPHLCWILAGQEGGTGTTDRQGGVVMGSWAAPRNPPHAAWAQLEREILKQSSRSKKEVHDEGGP